MNISSLSKNNKFIHILSKIRKIIPTAIIAGGAIRDLYHNKPINDIDIYVPLEKSKANNIKSVYSKIFWEQIFDLELTYDYISNSSDLVNIVTYEIQNYIGMVWEIQKADTLYNIIIVEVEPIKYVTEYFDIGLCKAYCDGTKVHLTADFMHDSKFKQLTVVSKSMPQEEFDHMIDYHVKKLKIKYPDYTLVIPPKYDKLYERYNKPILT